MTITLNPWLKGLIAAFVTGAAGTLANLVAAPETSLPSLLKIAVISGLIGAGAYLKRSPIPGAAKGEGQSAAPLAPLDVQTSADKSPQVQTSALLLLAAAALFAAGCTTVYENGRKLAVIGSNVKDLSLHTPAGTTLAIGEVDNAAIHKALGASLSQAALGIGSAVATSGLMAVF